MKEFIVMFLISALISALIFFGAVQLVNAKCHNQWPNKFNPEYHLVQGCTIETNEGRIPSENYRVI